VAFTVAALVGLLSFIPDPIALVIAVSLLLTLLLSRFLYHLSGNMD
jgi:hypothetical protein